MPSLFFLFPSLEPKLIPDARNDEPQMVIKCCLRVISRFRLTFMMGESPDNVVRCMHGFDNVHVNVLGKSDTEMIEPIMWMHRECLHRVPNVTLVLTCLPANRILNYPVTPGDETKLVVCRWHQEYGLMGSRF